MINRRELKLKDFDLYRSYYCGICHALEKRYGRRGQILLNYDMTFLAILLSGLYEPREEKGRERCLPHPGKPHPFRTSEAVLYAADMTVLLGACKAEDDWKDEKKLQGALLHTLLRKDYAAAAACYPRQARALEESLDALHRAEEAGTENLDEAAGTTGRFLAEIFAWKEDFWQDDLRRLGFYLGKFIYLADAYEDLEKDRKSGSYNVLLSWERQTGSRFEQETEAVLTDTMAQAARAYERLPIVRRADILGNIIYSGVWLRYGAARRRRETPEGSR